MLVTCQSGVWKTITYMPTVTFFNGGWPYETNMGYQAFCSINRLYAGESSADNTACRIQKDVNGNWLLSQKSGSARVYCDAVCFK